MAKRFTRRQLEKHLEGLEEKELIKEIGKLFSKFKEVKEYYQMEFGDKSEREKVLNAYKKKVRNQFYTLKDGKRRRPKASILRKLITEFKRVNTFNIDIVDLMLYRVECMASYTKDFGDMKDKFYESLGKLYKEVLDFIVRERLQELFKSRCLQVVKDVTDRGWGFEYELEEMYEEIFTEAEKK